MAIFKIAVEGQVALQTTVNVFFYEKATGTADDAAQAWIDTVANAYLNCISNNWSGYTVTATRLSDLTQAAQADSDVGHVLNDVASPQDACIVSWRTGIAGRAYRGRTYLPAVSENDITAGTVGAVQQGRMDLFGVAALSNMAAAGYNMVIYHRPLPPAAWNTGTGTQVTSWIVRPYVRTQRRRAVGVGI